MSAEDLYERARKLMGATEDERRRKMRARTLLMTKILAAQSRAQIVTPEILSRTCTL